jgi:hypothetical protein
METTAARKPARTPRVKARTAALLESVALPHRLENGNLVRAKSLTGCRFERVTLYCRYDAGLDRWIATRASNREAAGISDVIWTGQTRDGLLKPLKAHLRALWSECGIPCQLFLQDKRTGQFSEAAEATYGYDPKRSKG